jgi:hypothetical protein
MVKSVFFGHVCTYKWLNISAFTQACVISANIWSASVFVCPTSKKEIKALRNLCSLTGSTNTPLITYCVLLVPEYVSLDALVVANKTVNGHPFTVDGVAHN